MSAKMSYDRPVHDRIVSTPDVRFGKPRVRGTRIAVVDILDYMSGGDTMETLLEDFPQLTRDDILACLSYARHMIEPIAAE